MQDGDEFVFDHGMLSAKKIVDAIDLVLAA